MKTEIERWALKVNRSSDPSECWLWTGASIRGGYGHFRRKINGIQKMYKAHRFSYEHFNNNGEMLPSSTLVCHKCDNPKCVNPQHLFLGTQQDNINDKIKKGRLKWGIKRGFRIISEDDVKKIKEDYASGLYSMKEVGVRNNTSASQVCRIVNGITHNRKVGTED
jgi:hypothetical protein